jgi:regulation of enolase protein 1 (concanavalin A-like superfamily)
VPNVPGVPFGFEASDATEWSVDGGRLSATAPALSDLFVDPSGEAAPSRSAPTLLGIPGDGDFRLSARVTPGFATTFDAGVLLVRAGDDRFAKLCFELSPDAGPMAVSVVTRGVSDDANGPAIDAERLHLRVARTGRVYAFHFSRDGERWSMVRLFALGDDVEAHHVGFEVQSPMGEGCPVVFDEIRFDRETLADPRDGT